MNTTNRVQILDKAIYILHNTLGKGMNPTILIPAMSKIVEETRLFSLSMATSLGKGNSEFKLVILFIKN